MLVSHSFTSGVRGERGRKEGKGRREGGREGGRGGRGERENYEHSRALVHCEKKAH